MPPRPDDPGFGEIRAQTLGVRLAAAPWELDAAQALRYRVFYDEMGARPTPAMAATRRDTDSFDNAADHLLVIDHARGEGPETVVGTYRLLRRDPATRLGGFYSSAEYDISPLLGFDGEVLELGRSCVDAEYRTRGTLQLLWRGIAAYVFKHRIDLMFGCASLPGTDPEALAAPLTYLWQNHLAPPALVVDREPAAVAVARLAVHARLERRHLDALRELVRAARAKVAALRPVRERGREALDRGQALGARPVHAGDRPEQPPPRRRARALRVEGDLLLLQQALEGDLRLVARVVDLDLLAVGQRGDDLALARAEDDLVDRAGARLHPLDQLGVRDLPGRLGLRDQRLARQVHEQDDDDQGEERATKEAVHGVR